MEQKKKMSFKQIILIIIAVAASIFLISYFVEQSRNDKYIISATQQFNEMVKDLKNHRDTDGYISSIEVAVSRTSSGEDSIIWRDFVSFDVELASTFRELSKQERCAWIIRYKMDLESLVSDIKAECGYAELEDSSEKFRYMGKEHSLVQYTAEYFHDDGLSYRQYGDTFELEGRDNYTFVDEKYNFRYRNGEVIEFEEVKPPSYYVPKPTTPSKKYSHSSGSNKSNSSQSDSSGRKPSDPYDADTYDDPDDFATDWEDEFDSYDAAYDSWEDAMN